MQSARQYLLDGDYEQVIAAYKAAIELKPEDVDAYVGLVQAYMDNGQYVEANEIANLGFTATRDKRLEKLVQQITEKRFARNGKEGENTQESYFVAAGEDSENLSLRYATLEALSDYCYQEFLDNYGDSTITYVSSDEGYKVKFKGIKGEAYFKNTSEYPNLVDTVRRMPEKNARPYKYAISSPTIIFVGFDGYISHNRLWELIKATPSPVYDKAAGMYKISFDWGDSTITIETDAEGNVYKEDARIEICPKTLIKEEWQEETAMETEEETEPDTFELGGNTYTYDVTSIEIWNTNIGSLEALRNCTKLTELYLYNCTIDSLGPLAACQTLIVVDLRYSVGFSDISPLAGLENLMYLDLHGCMGVSDISPIMSKELALLHTCETAVTYEQTLEYKNRHPNCEVWYDNTTID